MSELPSNPCSSIRAPNSAAGIAGAGGAGFLPHEGHGQFRRIKTQTIAITDSGTELLSNEVCGPFKCVGAVGSRV